MVNVKTMIKAVTCGLVGKFPIHLDTTFNFLMGWTAEGQPSTEAGISQHISVSELDLYCSCPIHCSAKVITDIPLI